MAFWKKDSPKPSAPATLPGPPAKRGQAPRTAPRHPARAGLRTSLGRAIDLSATGARLHCETKPNLAPQSATPLEIFLLTGSEQVNARVCWVRRKGLYKPHWEMGLKFIAVAEAQGRRLSSIAEKGFLPTEEPATSPAESKPVARTGPHPAMVALEEHFDELGLGVEATVEEVRAAHRRLVRHCHPDVSNDENAKATFLRLQNSYHLIIDAFRERDARKSAAA